MDVICLQIVFIVKHFVINLYIHKYETYECNCKKLLWCVAWMVGVKSVVDVTDVSDVSIEWCDIIEGVMGVMEVGGVVIERCGCICVLVGAGDRCPFLSQTITSKMKKNKIQINL